MVDKNDTLFREVEEELRREQFAKLWERFGVYFIGLAVVVVAIVAGSQFWEARRIANANAAGAAYEAASTLLASGKTEEALKAFEGISSTGPKGYATLATLSEAGAYLKLDKRAEALATFDKLAGDTSADPLLVNFARLQAAALRLGEADYAEMETRLKPLTGDGNPWRFTARELLGSAALKAGKHEEARTTLTPLLADPGLGQSARERLHRLMGKIASSELAGAAAAAPSTAPAPAAAPAPESPAPAKDAEKPASAP